MSHIFAFIFGVGVCWLMCRRRIVEQGNALKAACDRLEIADRELAEADAREQRMKDGIARIQAKCRQVIEQLDRQDGRISGETAMIRQTAIAKGEGRNSEIACADSELRPAIALHTQPHFRGNINGGQ